MAAEQGWRRWRIGRTGAVEFLALAGLGLYMAAIGAFESGEEPALIRTLYWQAVIVGGGVIAAALEPRILRLPGMERRPRLFAVVQTLAMTPPITLLVWSVSVAMFGHHFELERYVTLLPAVFVVNVVVVTLAWLIRRSTAPRAGLPRPAAAPPAIAEKLPPKLARANLLAIEAQDHYLRVHTEAGQALILMRFADALAALEAREDRHGFQTHRSWWVAREAVETASFRDGRGELTLKGGVRAPVSRSHAEAIRKVDWA